MSATPGTIQHEINYGRDETHECEGIKGDGKKCTKRAKEFFGPPYGWRCGVHSGIGFLRQTQIVAYEKHQRAAFGGMVTSWTDDKLREREAATDVSDEGWSEERRITIRAEHDAVVAEIERRKGA